MRAIYSKAAYLTFLVLSSSVPCRSVTCCTTALCKPFASPANSCKADWTSSLTSVLCTRRAPTLQHHTNIALSTCLDCQVPEPERTHIGSLHLKTKKKLHLLTLFQ